MDFQKMISEMTLEEKLGMIHGDNVYDTQGVKRLGIPPFRFSDGPMGVRGEFDRERCDYVGDSDDYATSFPCPTAVAATWSPEMAYENGKTLGREVRGIGRDVSLSPGINLHRTPLCGRSFEYMAEDPCLISKIAVGVIRGIQENDVAACVKHFAANNQETRRYDVNVEIDERTFQELYLPGFQAAVQEGKSMAVMGAYNQFRGEYCCQNKHLLRDILRDQWGFDGIVISDWGAVHDTKKAIEAGTDFDMNVSNQYDEYYYANPLKKLIEDGEIPESAVDEILLRIFKTMERLHMFDENRQPGAYNTEENRQAILKVARESIVLLKNDRGILPLAKDSSKSILLVGENANRLQAFGGGSSEVRALFELTPLLGMKMHLGGNFHIRFAKGYSSEAKDAAEQERLKREACHLAADSDIVIYVGGLNHDFDMEGKDREDMKLPYGQDELIGALLDVKPDMVVVNMSGSPVEMGAWIDRAGAVVQYWYSGTMGGTALAEVLFGDVNPSGKLPTTFPKKLEDTPAARFGEFPGGDTVRYNEGIYVGYRYYDSYDVEPQFCFGHGLSYTDFEYSGLRIETTENSGGKVRTTVSCTVKNTGAVKGSEVVQLYVSDQEASVPRPEKELKEFQKVTLEPGESTAVAFELKERDFSFYCVEESGWKWEHGEFGILLGSSSRDIRLEGRVEL